MNNSLSVGNHDLQIGDICFGEVFVFASDHGRNLYMKLKKGSHIKQEGVVYVKISDGTIEKALASCIVEIVKGTFSGTL